MQANFLDLGGERKGKEADGGGFYSWELPLQKFLRKLYYVVPKLFNNLHFGYSEFICPRRDLLTSIIIIIY